VVHTCIPSAPWISIADRVNRRITIMWNPLGDSALGDHVISLVVHVTPSVGDPFSSSPIPRPDQAVELTIDNLNSGVSYVFRLVADTNNGPKTGLPVSIDF